MNSQYRWIPRYAAALFAAGAAFFLRQALMWLVGADLSPYVTFYPAVMIMALATGFGPGLLTTVTAALLATYFYFPPRGTFFIAQITDAVGLSLFMGAGIFICILGEFNKRSHEKTGADERQSIVNNQGEPTRPSSREGVMIITGFVLSLVVLMGSGWLSFRDLTNEAEADRLTTQSYNVVQKLEVLFSELKDVETSARGYILTGDQSHLDVYNDSAGKVTAAIAELKRLTLDNARQQQRITAIEPIVNTKLTLTLNMIELFRTRGFPAARAIVVGDEGKIVMDDIRRRVIELQTEEHNLLQQRLEVKTASNNRTIQGFLAGNIFGLLLISAVFFYLNREYDQRKRAETALRHHRDRLEETVVERTAMLSGEIEERKRSEAALRTSEEEFSAFFHNAAVGSAVMDMDGRFIQVNERLCRITGYSSEELQRMTPTELTHPDDRQREEQHLAAFRRGESPVYLAEKRYVRKDGRTIWIQAAVAMVRDAAGNRLRAAGIVQDITARREAEERLRAVAAELQTANIELEDSRRAAINLLEDTLAARGQAEQAVAGLRESEKQFRTLADAIPQLCWMANTDGSIFWYNQRWYDYTGTTPEQMEGWGWQSVHDPETLPEVVKRWQATIATGKIFDMVFPLRGSDGVFRPFLTRVMPVRDQNGAIVRWFGTNTDISEQRRTEEALQQTHNQLAQQMEERTRELREKEVLLKEIHHRVKNNLQVISSLVSLQADGSGNETMREGLRDVTYRVRSMALVHEKLYQSASLSRIDFAEYTRSLLHYLWRAHGSAAAPIGLILDLEPLSLPVDIAVPCGLILNELAGNTLKHAFSGRGEGKVTVSLQGLADGRACLRVHDNGVGLPKGFDWQQAGTLGLRLVQMLAGQLDAVVEVHSEEGTEVALTFEYPK